MPRVGTRHFPYTKRGYQEAREYAQATGQKVQVRKRRKASRKARKGVRDG